MSSRLFTPLFAAYDSSKPIPPPMPKLNGGLYTGEPFAKDAPYANVPVLADAGYMTHYNLASALPPPDATLQYPGGPRPGNNFQPMPSIEKAPGPYGLWCASGPCLDPSAANGPAASVTIGSSSKPELHPHNFGAVRPRLEGCPF